MKPSKSVAWLVGLGLLSLSPVALGADVKNGEMVAKRCQACHTFNKGGANRVGPNLFGVFGRPAGQVSGFKYSSGYKGFHWTAKALDDYLKDPRIFFSSQGKGTTKMIYQLPNPKDRADVIAYLQTLK